MPCYAEILGDCEGPLEREHFIPGAVQRLFGPVFIEGMAWQRPGERIELLPEQYAVGRVLCRKHHDDLDLLDPVARDFYTNFRLLADGTVRIGEPGGVNDWCRRIDGRLLERWMLKTICGAIASGNAVARSGVQERWIRALFSRAPWPDEYALHVVTDFEHVFVREDARLGIYFVWADDDGRLLGFCTQAFGFTTIFDVEAPLKYDAPKRPGGIGAHVRRPNGGPPLANWPEDQPLVFKFAWPAEATRDR